MVSGDERNQRQCVASAVQIIKVAPKPAMKLHDHGVEDTGTPVK
jgi:hypothetical protein